MAAYDPNTKEQIIKLKDGRTIYKTHNGFKCWLEDKNYKKLPITQEYYLKVKRSN